MEAGWFVCTVLILAMAGHSSGNWCVCKQGSDTTLQKTLDFACGAGADCQPTRQGGPCHSPDTVRDHCSYAVNSYFQRNRQNPQACDFSSTATIVASDPSTAGCTYPATASGTGTTTPKTTVGGTTGTTTPNGNSPLTTTPGVLGATNPSLGPSGMTNDESKGESTLPKSIISMILIAFATFLWWA